MPPSALNEAHFLHYTEPLLDRDDRLRERSDRFRQFGIVLFDVGDWWTQYRVIPADPTDQPILLSYGTASARNRTARLSDLSPC